MAVFFWQHDLDPEFPVSILEYRDTGDRDRLHWHDYLEIALCLDGAGRFVFGKRRYPIEPGDLFLIGNAEPHAGLSDPGRPLRLLLVLFRPELIAAPGCREFDAAYLSPFRNGDGSVSNRIPGSAPLAAELRAMLLELRAIWDRHDPADRHLLDASLKRFLATLVRHRPPVAAGSVWNGAERLDRHEQIRPMLTYVEQHFRENLTLEQVSDHVHVSPSRVRHLFKDVTSVGFKEYVTNLRLSEAKRLLLSTDVNVCDIARTVSYTNIHQFYKVFYRYSSMSPAEYRRCYTRTGVGDLVPGPGTRHVPPARRQAALRPTAAGHRRPGTRPDTRPESPVDATVRAGIEFRPEPAHRSSGLEG